EPWRPSFPPCPRSLARYGRALRDRRLPSEYGCVRSVDSDPPPLTPGFVSALVHLILFASKSVKLVACPALVKGRSAISSRALAAILIELGDVIELLAEREDRLGIGELIGGAAEHVFHRIQIDGPARVLTVSGVVEQRSRQLADLPDADDLVALEN